MHQLKLSRANAAENLAIDDALLETAQRAGRPSEVLRIWEVAQPAVVVGRSSRVAEEVDLRQCRRLEIPILRRTSGGAAVLIGPGCLLYSLVLSYDLRPHLRAIGRAHEFVLQTMSRAIGTLAANVQQRGTCDLTLGDRKFSGNSMRCCRDHLLYHGTVLYDFPLDEIDRCLVMPPRAPEYRRGRTHASFLTNVRAPVDAIREAIARAWNVRKSTNNWPEPLVRELLVTRYSCDDWNFRR